MFPSLAVPMPFSCPVCVSGGKNAESQCESNVRMEQCNTYQGQTYKDPVCAAFKMNDGSYFQRFCSSREQYNNEKSGCEEDGYCTIAMCEESACKAELPGSGITTFLRWSDLSKVTRICSG